MIISVKENTTLLIEEKPQSDDTKAQNNGNMLN